MYFMIFVRALSTTLRLLSNPFPAKVPILYPLKKPENPTLSCVFRGYKMGALVINRLKLLSQPGKPNH